MIDDVIDALDTQVDVPKPIMDDVREAVETYCIVPSPVIVD